MTLKRLATFSIVFLTLTAIPLTTKRTEAQAPSIISGKFYKFDVIAASNEAPLASILQLQSGHLYGYRNYGNGIHCAR